MTNDEQNTARELIEGAFADIINSAEKIETPADLAKTIARGLKADAEWYAKLREHSDAALLAIRVAHSGTHPHNPAANLGHLEIEVLARIPHKEATLLNSLTNPTGNYAYALALAAEHPHDNHDALLVIMATKPHGVLLSIAINDDENTLEAWQHRPDELPDDMPDDLRATITALTKAVAQ